MAQPYPSTETMLQHRFLDQVARTRALVWRRGGGRCWYCGIHLDPRDFHVDHVVPRAKGGGEGGNLVPACHGCNQRKTVSSLEEFRAREQMRLRAGSAESERRLEFFFEKVGLRF